MSKTSGKNVEEHIIVEEVVEVEEQTEDETVKRSMKKRKGRGTSSTTWDHFTRIPLSETNGEHKARCNYCPDRIFAAHPTKDGTSSLIKHMEKCPNNPNRDTKGQTLLSSGLNKMMTHHLFSQEGGRKAVARYIIKDEVPFRVVEKEGLEDLLKYFQPKFKMPSRPTISTDCYIIYKEEKEALKDYFKRNNFRMCFTTDCWTSLQNKCFMCLTAHWIDDDWILQKRILNFCEIEDHKGATIAKTLEDCIFNWGIDKVFSITVDNASANDSALAILKKRRKLKLVC